MDIKMIDGKPYVFYDGAFRPILAEAPAAEIPAKDMQITQAIRIVIWNNNARIDEEPAIPRVIDICAPGTTVKQVLNAAGQLQSDAKEIAIWPPRKLYSLGKRDWSITPKFKIPGALVKHGPRILEARTGDPKPKNSTQELLYKFLADGELHSMADCKAYVAANGGCPNLHGGHLRLIPHLEYDKATQEVMYSKPGS